MLKKEECLLVGTFTKTHGVKGELVFRKNSDLLERYEKGVVFIDIDGGLVPFFLTKKGYQNRNHESARLQFTDIDCEAKAKRFITCDIYILTEDAPELFQEEDMNLNLFVGFKFMDEKYGDLGLIEDIIDYNGNIVIQLTIKGQEVLIPFAEENIVEIDAEAKSLYMETPEGLIDMYLEE